MRTVQRLLVTALFTTSLGVCAQDEGVAPAPFAPYLQRATAAGSWTTVVSGQLQQGSRTTAPFGGGSNTADAGSRFALGNTAAVYSGLLLAEMAAAGRLRLDDPISRYLPTGFRCADERVCAITLQQLAAQDSGLPPLPANLFPRHPRQPWREYGEAQLLEFLANYHLPQDIPPRESALGLVLLGWILANIENDTFENALRRRVTTPLGLTATGFGDEQLLPGHRDGVEILPAQATSLGAVLELRSSVEDQLKLLHAMLRPLDSPLRNSLLLSRQPRNQRSSFGLGWRISSASGDDGDWPVVWQAGSGEGYASFIGFRTDRQQAVALLADADTSLMPLGLSVLGAAAQPAAPPAVQAAPENLTEYSGLYEFSPGKALVVREASSGLTAQPGGRLAARLRPLGNDLFDMNGSAVQLSFQRDALGRIEGLHWAENGLIVPVKRLSARAPQLPRALVNVPADTVAAICGDYVVDTDVLARFHCAPQPMLQFSGSAARELVAYAPDRYASGDNEFELVVERDGGNAVSALRLVLLGSETRLVRTQWQALPADLLARLHQERAEAALRAETEARVRAETAARQAAAASTTATPDISAIPWLRELPPPLAAAALAAPSDSGEKAAPAPATDAALAPPAPRADDAAIATSGPAAKNESTPLDRIPAAPARVNPVKPASPARVETLPEREPRHRFVPERQEDKKNDGT